MTNTEEINKIPDQRIIDLADAILPALESGTYTIKEKAVEIAIFVLQAGYLPSSALVRPLVWEGSASHREANTIAGKYWIATRANGEKLLYFGKENFISLGIFTKEDEAKIAAQSHFNTLIGSCLQGGGYTEERVVGFAEWLLKLTPRDRVTVWPPAGSGAGHGIYTKSVKELFTDYLTALKQQ